jgi:hypothetical protein
MSLQRRKALFCLILSGLGLIFLSLGMFSLKLQPGLPVPGAVETIVVKPTVGTDIVNTDEAPNNWWLQGTLALGFAVLLSLLLINLVRKANRNRILKLAGILAVYTLLLFLMPRAANIPSMVTVGGDISGIPSPVIYQIAPIGSPPAVLYWFVMGFLLLCAVILGIWLLMQFRQRPSEENPLARAAGAALQSIEDGQNLQNVIIRCYLDMEQTFREEQGFKRNISVTPREFETWLASHGVPMAPVHQLTRLFEKARYGSHPPDQQDEQAARTSLSAIIVNSQRSKTSPG